MFENVDNSVETKKLLHVCKDAKISCVEKKSLFSKLKSLLNKSSEVEVQEKMLDNVFNNLNKTR